MGLPFEGSVSNWIGIAGFTLIDLFAAAIILECIHPGSALGRALSVRPLRWLGVVSYGFYVYHDLLHDFYGYVAARFLPGYGYAGTVAVALLGTLAIATLSYLLMERPLLRLKERFAGQVHRAPVA
jgi:peptidoglycan/LPS O-acetylase OafA/YrhL